MADLPTASKPPAEPDRPRPLGIKAWPDMNIPNWGRWGFKVDRVLRTPRYHFFLQPRRATASELGGDSPAFSLEGEWFQLDETLERRMGRSAWPIYILVLLLFTGLLQAASMRNGLVAAAAFVAMYAVIEGFMPFLLRSLASDTRAMRVEIPWSSISRAVLLPGPGILLLSWEEKNTDLAVAIQAHPETARSVFDDLLEALPEEVTVKMPENTGLGRPPPELQRRE